MKKMRTLCNLACVMVAGLALFSACDNREVIEYDKDGIGEVNLKAYIQITLEDKVGDTDHTAPGTKSPVSMEDQLKDFVVTITKPSNNNEQIGQWKYSDLPEILTLKTGNYKIEAYSHSPKQAEWEKPYYYGSQEFTIKKSEVTTLKQMVCSMSNVGVKINYSQTLLDELKAFTVTVNNGKGFLEYGRNETREGYYMPATLTVTLTGERHDGERVDYVETISSVKAGQHHNVTVNVILVGALNTSLKIDMTTVLVEKDVVVPPGDDVITDPDNPNPDPGPTPTVLSIKGRNGLDIKQPIVYPIRTQKTVVVDITAESGIEDLWVEINSPFLTEDELNTLGIPKKFNLADLTPELQVVFGPAPDGLGLIGSDPVRGSKAMTFDITQFTNLLLTPDTHKFILTVTDIDGKKVSETLSLKPYE